MNKEQENNPSFTIEVIIPTTLPKYHQELPTIYTFDHPITFGELMTELKLNPQAIGLIVVNGVQSEAEDVVPNNAKVRFFSHTGGG
jgi:hypothetical protein